MFTIQDIRNAWNVAQAEAAENNGACAINLATGESMQYDSFVTDIWRVAYPYCAAVGKLPWLISKLYDKTFMEAVHELPIQYGEETICIGEWCTMKDKE